MGWTFTQEPVGSGADAIATILYELYQAAYERIEARYCYLDEYRSVKILSNMPLTDADYVDYYLPKYNGEFVTDTSPFLGLPIQCTAYMPIIQPIITALTASGLIPVWPNYVPIILSAEPDTALNSRFWRAAMAYVASYRLVPLSPIDSTQ